MKYLTTILLSAACALSLHAQTITPEVVAAKEKRVDLLRTELKELDARIETRLDDLIDMVVHLTDSKDSKTKVSRMKEKTVQALKKNTGLYVQKRAVLLEELRRPTLQLTEEQKRKLLAALDARTEKRIQAVLKLENSMPTHQDYEKYETTGGGYWGTEYRVNEDYRQNKRVTAHTNQMRDKVTAGLKQSIGKLEAQNKRLQAQYAATPSPAIKNEIARNNAFLTERRKQLSETLTAAATAGRAVSLSEAVNLDKTLQTAGQELSRDFSTLFARYNAFLPALADANVARAKLPKP